MPRSRFETVIFVFAMLAFVFFMGAMVFMGIRDHKAEVRCHNLGGQTWDSGTHCTIGGRVVNTR